MAQHISIADISHGYQDEGKFAFTHFKSAAV